MLKRLRSAFRKNTTVTIQSGKADQELGVHTIFIETISRCNLRCTYCHRTTNTYTSKNKSMDFVLFKTIIDQIDISNPLFCQTSRPLQGNKPCLYLHGYGEPTLHPELASQIAYASMSGKFYEIRIVSNLLAVPKESYQEYFAAGLTHLYVSLDTLNPERTVLTRVGTDVDRLNEAFTYLARHYADRIRVITVLSPVNHTELPMLYEYLGKLGIHEWIIQLMLDHEKHDFGVTALDVDQAAIELKRLQPYPMRVSLEGLPYPTCTQPFDTMVINVLGHVAACCTYFSNDYIDFGVVTTRSVMDIFQSSKFDSFREVFRRERPPLCKDCPMYGRSEESAKKIESIRATE